MASITAANSIIMLGVASVFPAPVQIQGFASDEVFDSEAQEIVETLMGVDGKLSGGFVNVPFKMSLTLQADSASATLFDAWAAAQKAANDTFTAFGTILLPSTGATTALVKGFLTGYKPMPDAKKLLQPRKFGITWESQTTAVL